MTLPAEIPDGRLPSWRGHELPESEGMRRNALLAGALTLLRIAAMPGVAVATVVVRTADLCAEDFDAAVDWLLDHAEQVVNPIPLLRRAAAENAKARAQRDVEARYAAAATQAVPMPPELRDRIRGLSRRSVPPAPDESQRRADALRAAHGIAPRVSDNAREAVQ